MSKRILILSASIGSGHLRAGAALEKAALELIPDCAVAHRDILDFGGNFFRQVYAKSYLNLIRSAPHLVGYLYDWTDRPNRNAGCVEALRKSFEKASLKRFTNFLGASRWDLILCTHSLPAAILAQLRKSEKLPCPFATICTDFDSHRLWLNQPCDRYFCATSEAASHLEFIGAPAEDVFVTGIPIDSAFSEHVDREEFLDRLNLRIDLPVILYLGSGLSLNSSTTLLEQIRSIRQRVQVIVVCGKNESLHQSICEFSNHNKRHAIRVLGFTDAMPQLTACADLVVSKPGGLTTSESLARGLPMVIVNPIPGQESRNSDYLLERGAAVKVNHPSQLRPKIESLLDDPDRMLNMRRNAFRISRPKAAREIVELSLEIGASIPEVERSDLEFITATN